MSERIGALIPEVLTKTAARHGTLFAIQRRWSQLVGKALAQRTRPVSVRRGTLVVQVERPGDGFTLSYQRLRILERVKTLTKGQVEEFVIRPGDGTKA